MLDNAAYGAGSLGAWCEGFICSFGASSASRGKMDKDQNKTPHKYEGTMKNPSNPTI